MKPHKYAELIKAWAGCAEIECYCKSMDMLCYKPNPGWLPSLEYRVKPKAKWKPKGKLPKGYLVGEKRHVAIPKEVHNYDMLLQFVSEHETDWDNQYCEVFMDFNQNYRVLGCDTYPSLGTIRMSEQCAEQLCEMLNNGEIEL